MISMNRSTIMRFVGWSRLSTFSNTNPSGCKSQTIRRYSSTSVARGSLMPLLVLFPTQYPAFENGWQGAPPITINLSCSCFAMILENTLLSIWWISFYNLRVLEKFVHFKRLNAVGIEICAWNHRNTSKETGHIQSSSTRKQTNRHNFSFFHIYMYPHYFSISAMSLSSQFNTQQMRTRTSKETYSFLLIFDRVLDAISVCFLNSVLSCLYQ